MELFCHCQPLLMGVDEGGEAVQSITSWDIHGEELCLIKIMELWNGWGWKGS